MIRNALVTGGTGFFGSRLVRLLLQQGIQVTVLARPASNWHRLEKVRHHLLVHEPDTPVKVLFANPTDLVVHAATCYGRQGETEAQIRETNFDWPKRLLEAATERGVSWFWNCDTSLPTGLNPYSDWKNAFREALRSAANSNQIGVLNMRLESLYGPGDDSTKFITQLLHALLSDAPSFPMTMGKQSRDYLYVDDAVEAARTLLTAIDSRASGWLHVGVGYGETMSVREFAERLRRAVGARTVLRFGALPMRQGELMETRADIAVLQDLGWRPQVPLDEGIARLVAAARAEGSSMPLPPSSVRGHV